MIDEDKIINNIWDKYENYSKVKNKDKFYKKNHFKHNSFKYSTLLTCLVVLIGTFSIGYAGKLIYDSSKNKIIQESTKTDFEKNEGYNYIQDMIPYKNLYYKVVLTYKDYLTCVDRWDNILNMTENDFENYFVLIIANHSSSVSKLQVSNTSVDNDTLYIELLQDSEFTDNKVLFVKLPLEQYRENLDLKIVGEVSNISGQVSILDLPFDYSEESAIKDGCIVIENTIEGCKIVSGNSSKLEKFIEDCQNGINTSIRIAEYVKYIPNIYITDIEYKDGVYILIRDNTRTDYNAGISYNYGSKIKYTTNESGSKNLQIYDDRNNKYLIFLGVKF